MSKTIKGIVETVNENGIKIEGQWFNFSKFDEVDVPSEGDAVEIQVDGTNGKWIKELNFIEGFESMKQEYLSAKDMRITRLSLVSSAVQMLKTEGRAITTEEVTRTARRLETYVYSGKEQSEDDVPF